MYKTSELKTLIPFDIETLPIPWGELSKGLQKLWIEKSHYRFYPQEIEHQKKKDSISKHNPEISNCDLIIPTFEEIYNKYAGLSPEFSRVWCISFGVFSDTLQLTVNTLQEESEKEILEQWVQVLEHYDELNLAGHNIDGFDIPFILARMAVNGLVHNYPVQLQLKDAKPWTVKHVDFMNDWKGQRREGVSLGLICEILNVPTPKDKFNNDEFTTLMLSGKITTTEGIEYCEKDVVALANCMIKCSSESSNFGGSTTVKKWAAKKK